jgi:thiamine biosynthesis lipoprotein
MRMSISILLLAFAGATGPSDAESIERARYLMGSRCTITAAHADSSRSAALVEEAFREIARQEQILSDYTDASELSRLNSSAAAEAIPVSTDLLGFLEKSLEIAVQTGGAFDPTIGPLVDLYALRDGGRWPAPEEIRKVLRHVGHGMIHLDSRSGTARLDVDGMRLDPGAIGKGFALDAAARILKEGGVQWALLDFGRQILAVGGGPDGCGFPVEVSGTTAGRDRPTARIYLRDASAATSANSERGLLVDGRPLGHVIDPRSGVPATKAASVTVVAPDATRADALSTALFVQGPEQGIEMAERLHVAAAILPAGEDATEIIKTPDFDKLARPDCAGFLPAPPAPSIAVGHGESP